MDDPEPGGSRRASGEDHSTGSQQGPGSPQRPQTVSARSSDGFHAGFRPVGEGAFFRRKGRGLERDRAGSRAYRERMASLGARCRRPGDSRSASAPRRAGAGNLSGSLPWRNGSGPRTRDQEWQLHREEFLDAIGSMPDRAPRPAWDSARYLRADSCSLSPSEMQSIIQFPEVDKDVWRDLPEVVESRFPRAERRRQQRPSAISAHGLRSKRWRPDGALTAPSGALRGPAPTTPSARANGLEA